MLQSRAAVRPLVLGLALALGLVHVWLAVPADALLRISAICPECEINHDTFLFLCSLDVNEQNLGLDAYRNYQVKYHGTTTLTGVFPFTADPDGRTQPSFVVSTKGCSYRSDFNAGSEAGATDYKVGVEHIIHLQTEHSEVVEMKIFRALPVWDSLTKQGTVMNWLFEATFLSNNNARLLPEPCTGVTDQSLCVKSTTYPTWNTIVAAYIPG